jgi:hypothetical protein
VNGTLASGEVVNASGETRCWDETSDAAPLEGPAPGELTATPATAVAPTTATTVIALTTTAAPAEPPSAPAV